MSKPSKFVTKEEWGSTLGRQATPRTHPIGATKGVTIHWEGPHMGSFPHSQCAGKVRGIEKFHEQERGWADLAYSGIFCPHGYVFEGRGVNTQTAANGSTDDNDDWYALCYLGGQGDPFTAEAKVACIEGVQWLRSEGDAGRDVNGHRDHKATACPGDVIYRWLGTADFNADPTPPKPEVPTVTWTTPIDKDPRAVAGAVTLQTVTANVKELPRHDATIAATFKAAATGCQLAGFQETGNPVYVKAMQDTLVNHSCSGVAGDPQHNVSIAYDKAMFKRVASGWRKLFDGEDGISHTRHALWVEVQSLLDPSFRLVLVSAHYPSGAFDPDGTPRDSGDRIPKRVAMWNEANAAMLKLLEELATKGHAMVVFGDFNRQKVRALPATVAGRKTSAVANALDWIFYIDGPEEEWETHESNKVDIQSDHRALQNRATLTRV